MNKDDIRRRTIFNKYSENLHLLVENDFISGIELPYPQTYLCPICLRPFSEHDLNQHVLNPLTLEDAPPKKLGGKANVLTCKECNNKLGAEVDSHLVNNFTRKELQQLRPNTTVKAYFTNKEGIEVKGKLTINSSGVFTAHHSLLNNKPEFVQAFADSITDIPESRYINMKLDYPDIDKEKLKISLLKTAYLMMFQKFGYHFLFEEAYKRIRNQLQEPTTLLYNFESWYHFHPSELLPSDVYFVREPLMKSWLACFHLKTDHSTYFVSIFLPLFLPVQYMIMGYRDIIKYYKTRFAVGDIGKVTFGDYQKILSMMTVPFADKALANIEQNERLAETFNLLR